MTAAERLLTADEFLLLSDPADGGKTELVDGRVVTTPPPGDEHGVLAFRVGELLSAFTRPHRLGDIRVETGFIPRRVIRAP